MSKKAQSKKGNKAASPKKYVYFFGDGKADGDRTMKDLLGGKGSGLAEMTNAGLPVPPGFTITTEVCNIYYGEKAKIPAAIDREIDEPVKKLEKAAGATLGSTENPLLVSVRSGRQVLDARHDGHDPEPRPERRCRRRAEEPDPERPVRVRQLPALHPDVRQRRPRNSEGCVRARVRSGQIRARREDSTPTSTRTRCARSSSATRASCSAGRASRFRRIRGSSCRCRATPCSARG